MVPDSGVVFGIPYELFMQIMVYVGAPPIAILITLIVRRKFLSRKGLVIENAISSVYQTLQFKYGKKSSYTRDEVSQAITKSGLPDRILSGNEVYIYQMYMNRREFEGQFPEDSGAYGKRRDEILSYVSDFESMAAFARTSTLGDVDPLPARFHWFNFRRKRVIAFIRHLDGHMRLLFESRHGRKPYYFKYEVDSCLPKTRDIGRYVALAYGEYLSEKDFLENNGRKWPSYAVVNDELEKMREMMLANRPKSP